MGAEWKKNLSSIILWLVCCAMYLSIGMVIFVAIEAENTDKIIAEKTKLRQDIRQAIQSKMNFSKEEFDIFMKTISDAYSADPKEWTYPSAFALSLQTITTIGYGVIAPLTTGGRVFCIFYSLFGIPLVALLLQATGNALFGLIRSAIVIIEKKIKKTPEAQNAEFKSSAASFILLWLVILIFAALEEDYFEGVYGWFITLTTIGYGDVIPGKGYGAAFVWVRVIFMLVGLSFTASVLNSLGSWISESQNMKLCKCFKSSTKQEWSGEVKMDEHTETTGTYRKNDAI